MLLQTTTRGKVLDCLSAVGGHIHGCGASSDDLASIIDVDHGSPFLALVPRHGVVSGWLERGDVEGVQIKSALEDSILRKQGCQEHMHKGTSHNGSSESTWATRWSKRGRRRESSGCQYFSTPDLMSVTK